jgi:predicted cupin superfamily sugar epimerase
VVAPGFDFAKFELAPGDFALGDFAPAAADASPRASGEERIIAGKANA